MRYKYREVGGSDVCQWPAVSAADEKTKGGKKQIRLNTKKYDPKNEIEK